MAKQPRKWLGVNETAVRCGVSTRTLLRWRKTNDGPRPYQVTEKKAIYDEDDVETWISGRQK